MSASASITVSVTSSTSDAGSRPVDCSARRTSSTIDSDCSCLTERLTLIVSAGSRGNRCCSCAALAARLAEHPPADRDDQAGLLGERDELRRRDEPARRVVPAQQRLDAVVGPPLEADDRLVVDLELLRARARAAARRAARAARRRARASRARTAGNGPCCRASPCTWRRRRCAAAPRRPAKAGPRRSCRCRRSRAGRPACPSTSIGASSASSSRSAIIAASSSRDAVEQDRELVAAEARDGVGRPDGLLEPARRPRRAPRRRPGGRGCR